MRPDLSSAIFKYAVYLPVVALRGERVFHYLKDLERSQWLDVEQVRAVQEEKLERLLRYSYAHVPFYRMRLDGSSATMSSPLKVLNNVPFTTKHDLIHSNTALRSERHWGFVT